MAKRRRRALDVEVVGIDDLIAELERVSANAQEEMDEAVEAAAVIVEKDAKAHAPRGATGVLSREIIRYKGRKAKTAVHWDVGPTKLAFYGRFQEFGTRHHAAQPFLRPAFDANRERGREIIREHIRDAIERAI